MLRSTQFCKKCTILGNLRTITQDRDMKTRQMTPFFSSTFWAQTVSDIHICISECQNSFSWNPLWSILVCEIPEICRWKLWKQNIVSFDSGNINIKESKKPGLTFSVELRTKFVWSHVLFVKKIVFEWNLYFRWTYYFGKRFECHSFHCSI